MGKSQIRKLTSVGILLLSGIITIPSILNAAERIAVSTKVKGTVEIQSSKNPSFKPLSPGTVLFNKDLIRTGANGFLVMVYLDDKSMLKVKSNTSLEILGRREGSGISKKVDMIGGTLKADVSKQRKGDFVISTPTSVASVKGTSFWMVSEPGKGDRVYGLEGVVELLNLVSGSIVLVGENQTGTSAIDGSLNLAATITENVPEDEEEAARQIKELRIYFEDATGEERVLIIKYN